jgi:hypothetical protein
VKIHGNIDEYVFLQYCEKLWNTTNINELKLEWNSDNHVNTVIISDELERILKIKKKCKVPENITVIQSYASTTRRVRTEITTTFK